LAISQNKIKTKKQKAISTWQLAKTKSKPESKTETKTIDHATIFF